ncbi:MAG: carboxypeptidase-like regulatory domain-containing protein, partial [Desulfurococcaceae archaeon]
MVAGQVTEGALKLWVKTLLVMQGLRFMVSGSVTGGKVETDPQKIAEMVRVVKVNGIPVNVIVKDGKAVAPFIIPGGAERLFISFEAPLYADITIYANMCLKRDFDTIAQLGFATNFHFNWKDQRIILYKLEFVDMTMPLVAAERIFRTAAYTFSHNIEEYFEVKQEWNDTSSPTGKRYYYATRNNVHLFDPLNGGILQYCKNFSVNYYYQEPPDVAIDIIFNGTDRATSLAQHAVVRLTSNTPQTVRFRARALVFTYEGTREVVFRTVELCSGYYAPECETRIGPEGVAFVPFDIRDLVAEAIARSKELEKVVGVKVVAWITQAEQNRLTHNDNATAVYYPPLGLVREYGAPALLFVYVHNALNGTPVVGATVIVSNGTTSQTAETNGTGWASFSLYTGLWNVTVSKTGYHSYTTQHLIVTNVSTLNVPLVPVSFSIPTNPETGQPVFPPQNHTDVPPITYHDPSTNETEYYWWVSVQVVWRDGFPFQGAHVTMVDAEKGTTIFEGTTNGTGFVHVLVENGTRLSIEVTATHPENSSLQYTETRNITVTRHWWLTFRVPWESQYFEPEVGLVSLQLLVHEGLGAFYGSVHHLVLVTLWTNTPQRVLLYVSIVDAENRTLSYQEVEVNLTQMGVYEKPVWLPVNLERGGYVRAYARVVEYERDTNPDNNEMWSSQVFLRPF